MSEGYCALLLHARLENNHWFYDCMNMSFSKPTLLVIWLFAWPTFRFIIPLYSRDVHCIFRPIFNSLVAVPLDTKAEYWYINTCLLMRLQSYGVISATRSVLRSTDLVVFSSYSNVCVVLSLPFSEEKARSTTGKSCSGLLYFTLAYVSIVILLFLCPARYWTVFGSAPE